jgi:quinol monooxygenase YgiN
MFARATTVQIRPDAVDQAISIYRESVVPAAQAQKGFVSTSMLTDRASGKGLAVTVWQTMEDLLASESSGYYQEQVAKFAPILTAAPMRETYEVSVSA